MPPGAVAEAQTGLAQQHQQGGQTPPSAQQQGLSAALPETQAWPTASTVPQPGAEQMCPHWVPPQKRSSKKSLVPMRGVDMDFVPVEGKRKRKRTTFADFQMYDDHFGDQEVSRAIRDVERNGPSPTNRSGKSSKKSTPKSRESSPVPPPINTTVGALATAPSPQTSTPARKTPGIANATRRIMEWVQDQPLSLQEASLRLSKMSRVKVHLVLDTLRACRMLVLVRRDFTDEQGVACYEEYYKLPGPPPPDFPVDIPSLSRDLLSRAGGVTDMRRRVQQLQPILSQPPQGPASVAEVTRGFLQEYKGLEDDPFFALCTQALQHMS